MKKRFIRAIAEWLAGPNQARMSILLQMGREDAVAWAKIRGETPLFGYPTVEEAEEKLTRFLG